MESPNYSQLELFSQANKHSASRHIASESFLSRIRAYEKIIFILMGFMITAIVAFSLGVEKGRKIAALRQEARFDTANKKQPVTQAAVVNTLAKSPQAAPVIKPQGLTQKPVEAAPVKPVDSLQNYAIQLASYKNRSSAQKELDLLNKKGFSALMMTKGAYTVLYVGKFSDKETAKAKLSELEKRYHGCFIRRI